MVSDIIGVKQRNKSSKSSGMRKNVRKRRKVTNHVNRRLWHLPHPVELVVMMKAG